MTITRVKDPTPIGSYSPSDVIFLLKDISDVMEEKPTEDREEAIQSGVHYSEMLPIEYNPSEEYMKLFYSSLEQYKKKLAIAVGVVAMKIIEDKGMDIVLVSLARAGTPVGILIKRYIEHVLQLTVPHYSVSIIRGIGIDENAIKHILMKHPNKTIQFIDGWTGKGAIKKELDRSVMLLNKKNNQNIRNCMAVLADPGNCASIYGTRDDFLIPSACLNSTVSGLVSRTVLNEKYIGEYDFHGAKYYKELEEKDVSHYFIETICSQFQYVEDEVKRSIQDRVFSTPSWKGLEDIKQIQADFEIENINLVKPGVGETTRVLLRRVPWKILVKDLDHEDIKHILLLAKERNIPVERYEHMSYICCGLIKPLKEKRL